MDNFSNSNESDTSPAALLPPFSSFTATRSRSDHDYFFKTSGYESFNYSNYPEATSDHLEDRWNHVGREFRNVEFNYSHQLVQPPVLHLSPNFSFSQGQQTFQHHNTHCSPTVQHLSNSGQQDFLPQIPLSQLECYLSAAEQNPSTTSQVEDRAASWDSLCDFPLQSQLSSFPLKNTNNQSQICNSLPSRGVIASTNSMDVSIKSSYPFFPHQFSSEGSHLPVSHLTMETNHHPHSKQVNAQHSEPWSSDQTKAKSKSTRVCKKNKNQPNPGQTQGKGRIKKQRSKKCTKSEIDVTSDSELMSPGQCLSPTFIASLSSKRAPDLDSPTIHEDISVNQPWIPIKPYHSNTSASISSSHSLKHKPALSISVADGGPNDSCLFNHGQSTHFESNNFMNISSSASELSTNCDSAKVISPPSPDPISPGFLASLSAKKPNLFYKNSFHQEKLDNRDIKLFHYPTPPMEDEYNRQSPPFYQSPSNIQSEFTTESETFLLPVPTPPSSAELKQPSPPGMVLSKEEQTSRILEIIAREREKCPVIPARQQEPKKRKKRRKQNCNMWSPSDEGRSNAASGLINYSSISDSTATSNSGYHSASYDTSFTTAASRSDKHSSIQKLSCNDILKPLQSSSQAGNMKPTVSIIPSTNVSILTVSLGNLKKMPTPHAKNPYDFNEKNSECVDIKISSNRPSKSTLDFENITRNNNLKFPIDQLKKEICFTNHSEKSTDTNKINNLLYTSYSTVCSSAQKPFEGGHVLNVYENPFIKSEPAASVGTSHQPTHFVSETVHPSLVNNVNSTGPNFIPNKQEPHNTTKLSPIKTETSNSEPYHDHIYCHKFSPELEKLNVKLENKKKQNGQPRPVSADLCPEIKSNIHKFKSTQSKQCTPSAPKILYKVNGVDTKLDNLNLSPDLVDRLTNNLMEVADCNCLSPEHVPSEAIEGPYYTQLGAARDLPTVRKMMEQRTGVTGQALRIEKIIFTGKEGKSKEGCPVAKWIIRRSGPDEKFLCVVRQRPGHFCDTSVIIVVIVAWEGVMAEQADSLYNFLITTLPKSGIETDRRCGLNEKKTCACQGVDLLRRGASFSFGCSWSMYYNGCKFARSQSARKFKLKDVELEEVLSNKLEKLASDVAPLYKRLAPDSYRNQTQFERQAEDCRLGKIPGRPFSGVTAVVDFCCHSHKDSHNMNNGCTVVVNLTKHRGFEKPDDEQYHILPLYILDQTDEFGSMEGQADKIQQGSLQVLSRYMTQVRTRSTPYRPCKRNRTTPKKQESQQSPKRPRLIPQPQMNEKAPLLSDVSPGRKSVQFNMAPGVGVDPVLPENMSYTDLMSQQGKPGFSDLYTKFWDYFYIHGIFPPRHWIEDISSHPCAIKVSPPSKTIFQPSSADQMFFYQQQEEQALNCLNHNQHDHNPEEHQNQPVRHHPSNHSSIQEHSETRQQLPVHNMAASSSHNWSHTSPSPSNFYPTIHHSSGSLQNETDQHPFTINPGQQIVMKPLQSFTEIRCSMEPSYNHHNNGKPLFSSSSSSRATTSSIISHSPTSIAKPSGALTHITPEVNNQPFHVMKNVKSDSQCQSGTNASTDMYHYPNPQFNIEGTSRQHESETENKTCLTCHVPLSLDSHQQSPNEQRETEVGSCLPHHVSQSHVYSLTQSSKCGPRNEEKTCIPQHVQYAQENTQTLPPPSLASLPPNIINTLVSSGGGLSSMAAAANLGQDTHPQPGEKVKIHKSEGYVVPTSGQDPREPPYQVIDSSIMSIGTDDNHEVFEDPAMGGVAIALCHGAVLFEVAKRELHATSALREPNRYQPKRISLVFYQHKNLNLAKHGLDEYEKKMEERKSQTEQAKLIEEMESHGFPKGELTELASFPNLTKGTFGKVFNFPEARKTLFPLHFPRYLDDSKLDQITPVMFACMSIAFPKYMKEAFPSGCTLPKIISGCLPVRMHSSLSDRRTSPCDLLQPDETLGVKGETIPWSPLNPSVTSMTTSSIITRWVHDDTNVTGPYNQWIQMPVNMDQPANVEDRIKAEEPLA